MSRALVHTYLGDRRGLIDAVQVRIVGRLDTWVGHGLRRADTPEARLRALVQGVYAFVVAEHDAWGVLGTSGDFDHPALHGVRARWAATLTDDEVRGQAVVQKAERIGDAVQLAVRVTVEVEGQDKPGCVADTLARFVFMPAR